MVHKGTSSSYRSVDCIGLWSYLVYLSVFQVPLCLRSLRCYIYLKNFCLHPSLYLLVSWAWWNWPLTLSANHCPSVLWHCWLGHLTRKIVSKMTYNVSSGTLNPTIPYLYPARVSGECCKLPSGSKCIFRIFEPRRHAWWQRYCFFLCSAKCSSWSKCVCIWQ